MNQPDIDVQAVDVPRIVAVSRALGAPRFVELLAVLAVRLQGLSAAIDDLPEGAADLALSLHQSRGSAASLGLAGLAILLTDIEARIARPNDPAEMAGVKIAGRTLQAHGRAAARAATHHAAKPLQDHASGMCSR
jgi:hypothetical protein